MSADEKIPFGYRAILPTILVLLGGFFAYRFGEHSGRVNELERYPRGSCVEQARACVKAGGLFASWGMSDFPTCRKYSEIIPP